jgi:hypothetical protein
MQMAKARTLHTFKRLMSADHVIPSRARDLLFFVFDKKSRCFAALSMTGALSIRPVLNQCHGSGASTHHSSLFTEVLGLATNH